MSAVDSLHAVDIEVTSVDYTLWIYTSVGRLIDYTMPIAVAFNTSDDEPSRHSYFDGFSEYALATTLDVDEKRVPLQLRVRVTRVPTTTLDALDRLVPIGRSPLARTYLAPLAPMLGFVRAAQQSMAGMQRRMGAWLEGRIDASDGGSGDDDASRRVRITLPSAATSTTRRLPRVFAFDPFAAVAATTFRPVFLDARAVSSRPLALRAVLRDDAAARRRSLMPPTGSDSVDKAAGGLLDVGNVVARFFEVLGGLATRRAATQ